MHYERSYFNNAVILWGKDLLQRMILLEFNNQFLQSTLSRTYFVVKLELVEIYYEYNAVSKN